MGYFSAVLAEPAAQQASRSSLADELRAQWGGDWNISGIDRADELAQMLMSKGVNSLDGLKMGYDRPYTVRDINSVYAENVGDYPDKSYTNGRYLDFGGIQIGHLSHQGTDSSYQGPNGYSDVIGGGGTGGELGDNEFGWSSAGHGAVGYSAVPGPDGRVQIVPNWSSSSDMDEVREGLTAAALIYGGAALGGGAFGGLGGFGSELSGTIGSSVAPVGSSELAAYGASLAPGELAGTVSGLDIAGMGGLGGAGASAGTAGSGLTLGGSAGYGSILASPSALGAGGAGLSSGVGLTAPAFAGGGSGIVGGLGMTAGAGAAASAGGGVTSLLSSLGTVGGIRNLASIASGIYGMSLAGDARDAADPFAQYRPTYGAQLAALEANPGSITSRPGFQAGIETIQRKAGARGYAGSGNMLSSLSRYSGDFYNQEATRLAGLAGAGQTPGAGQLGSAELASQSLGSIGYGLAPLLERFMKGG